jgi:hypothetical protein
MAAAWTRLIFWLTHAGQWATPGTKHGPPWPEKEKTS